MGGVSKNVEEGRQRGLLEDVCLFSPYAKSLKPQRMQESSISFPVFPFRKNTTLKWSTNIITLRKSTLEIHKNRTLLIIPGVSS